MRPWEVGDPPTITTPGAPAPRLDPAAIAAAFGGPRRVRVALRRADGKTFVRIDCAGRLLAEVAVDGEVTIELDI